MARIELKGVRHVYKKGDQETVALKRIDLAFPDGCAGALLGPSGCGKSTLLNILSGLLTPTEGQVFFDGVDVTQVAPEERNIAQLFQFPVVYDSMSVYDNLAFPLKNRGVEKLKIDERVRRVAGLLELTDYLSMRPRRIGPGERQLVALGRGIVREDTRVILLDEPMTQIDLHQRWKLRRELNRVQANLGITMIYVTHDQYEALTFAEKVVVMNHGVVVQEGTADELYERPTTPFVGYFIGTPGMNILPFQLSGNRMLFEGFELPARKEWIQALNGAASSLEFGLRPEYVACSETEKPDWAAAEIRIVEHMGEFMVLTLDVGGTTIKSKLPLDKERFSDGQKIWFSFGEYPEKALLYREGHVVGSQE